MSSKFAEYKTVSRIAGPLMLVENVDKISYGELVDIELADGEKRQGQVLETYLDKAVVQVFEGTSSAGLASTKIKFTGHGIELPVSLDMLGRVFDGLGRPIDKGPKIVPEMKININGSPINPTARANPSDFVQTGISAIDGMNTLVRGQKLPIFSGSGLPHNELAIQIAKQAKVLSSRNSPFSIPLTRSAIAF